MNFMALLGLVARDEAEEGFVMTIIACDPNTSSNPFRAVAEPFLRQEGLPFAEVLTAEEIHQAFADHDALFAGDDIYGTEIVLWAFLAQSLRDGKGASCAQAVKDIRTYQVQIGGQAPCDNTGDYCRARAKLSRQVLRNLARQAAKLLEKRAKKRWLWHGLHAKLIDGSTITMPDTPENQEAFPQLSGQQPGVGFPIARICVVLSLATGCIHDLAMGPYEGKETGETALLRTLLDGFGKGEVAVFDRYYCSYMMLALLKLRGVDVCARLHQCRGTDLSRVKRLGPNDHLVTWTRPPRPAWMSQEMYETIPETLTLRQVEFQVSEPGKRAETIVVVTTLTDPRAYSAADIAELYGFRWNAELDIRQIKQTLNLDHLRCKSPEMVEREVWATLLGYNLIRKVIAAAAAVHEKQPRQLSFTGACNAIESSWMLLATGSCRDTAELWRTTLEGIAAHEVANRPGRIEPRVLKRRRHRYPLMTRSRADLRAELAKT
jgi:putative transposase